MRSEIALKMLHSKHKYTQFADNTANEIGPSSFSSPSLLFALSISPLQVRLSAVFTLGDSYVYGGTSVRGRGWDNKGEDEKEGMRERA